MRLPYACIGPTPSRTRRTTVLTALGEPPDRQPRTASSTTVHTAAVPTGLPTELAANTHTRPSETRLARNAVARLPGAARGVKLRSISVLSETIVPTT